MDDKIRILAVDDEPMACRKIRRFLQDDPQVDLLEITDPMQAAPAIDDYKPHLVLLDIQMPGRNGFDVLNEIKSDWIPYVIFVTAYDQYAIHAFEVHALDYLLKPFTRQRFQQAVQRAKNQIRMASGDILDQRIVDLLLQLKKGSQYLSRIAVKKEELVYFVRTRDIDWIEGAGKYVYLHTGEDSHLVREGMNTLARDLDPLRFVRIHKSSIVNVDRITELRRWFHGDYQVILSNGTQLTLSRRYSKKLSQALGRPL